MSDNQSENSDYWLPKKPAMSTTDALPVVAWQCGEYLWPARPAPEPPSHNANALCTVESARAAIAAERERCAALIREQP